MTILRRDEGQSAIEFAMILPLLLTVVLGVVEVSYALLDQHVVAKLSREGANLISRDTSLADAATALIAMESRPVDFSSNSTVIFSVLKKGGTTGTSNYNQTILYQRYKVGALAVSSALTTRGGGSFGGAPDFEANNSDNDTNLQITNLPSNLAVGTGSLVYVTEIFTTHTLITPFDRFGVSVPTQLYSIAYF